MTLTRRIILALAVIAGIYPAIAQVPPPVPALPDTERRTTYSISASTCACAVGFQLYGDSTDYTNWIEVFVNGAAMSQAGNWTITSPTGSLATIPRPITDAVLTFTSAQTGTIQIVGARRPRRASQFSESRGVAARDLNQVLTDIIAMERETWDKTNDVTGRTPLAPPGETMKLLPSLSGRASMNACFDSAGNLTSCVQQSSGSFAAGAGISFSGTNPTSILTNPSIVPTLSGNNAWAGTNTWAGTSKFSGDANFYSGRPWIDVRGYGATCTSGSNDTVAIQNAINAADALGGVIVFFPPGGCNVTTTLTVAQPTCLVGANGGSATGPSSISGNADFTVVSFAANKAGACLRDISIFGYINTAAANPAVRVGLNSAVHMSNCLIWGGSFALTTAGVDGRIYNCYFAGWNPAGGGISSTGSNFWVANKIDQAITPTSFGFLQGIPPALSENHFTGNDFSGNYSVASFYSDDGGGTFNINIHHGSIFSSPVILLSSRFTTIVGSEIGVSVSNASGPLSISGSYGFSPITATGAGARSCAANVNITC